MERSQLGKATTILSYSLFVMTVTHTLTHSFGNMHTALFPTLKVEFLLTNQQLGLIAAIPPLCQSILSIPTGILSDRLGSKKMIIISQLVASGGALLASVTQNMWMLIAAVSLLYISTTIYHPASYSFTTRLFQPQDRSKALGLHGAGGTFGMAIGPISLGLLMGLLAFGWRQVYLFWAFPLILGIIAVRLIKSEPVEDVEMIERGDGVEEFQATKLLTASMLFFLIYSGIRMVAGGMTNAFLNVYLVDIRGWEQNLASIVYGSSSLMGIIAAPIGGFLAARFGEKKWTLTVLTLSYLCFGLAFFIPGTLAFTTLYLGHGFFNFLSMASNSAMMARLSPGRQRGIGFALYFLPGSLMGAIAPIIAAFIADNMGIFTIFPVSTVVFFLAVLVLLFGVKLR
jgi:MFS family permease